MKQIEITDVRDIGTCSSSMEEQETVIVIERTEDYVDIWTCDNTMITKLSRVMKTYPDTWKCFEGSRDSKGNVSGYCFRCPKKAISFRGGNTIIRKSKKVEEEV